MRTITVQPMMCGLELQNSRIEKLDHLPMIQFLFSRNFNYSWFEFCRLLGCEVCERNVFVAWLEKKSSELVESTVHYMDFIL